MSTLVTISISDVTVTRDSLSKTFLQSLCLREQLHGTSKVAMVMLEYKVLASVLSKEILATLTELPEF